MLRLAPFEELILILQGGADNPSVGACAINMSGAIAVVAEDLNCVWKLMVPDPSAHCIGIAAYRSFVGRTVVVFVIDG